jgi:hypothetical protein
MDRLPVQTRSATRVRISIARGASGTIRRIPLKLLCRMVKARGSGCQRIAPCRRRTLDLFDRNPSLSSPRARAKRKPAGKTPTAARRKASRKAS